MMGKAKFPRIRPDGSFCVVIRLTAIDRHGLASDVNEWLNNWALANEEWIWDFEDGNRQVMYLSDQFQAAPTAIMSSNDEISVCLVGQPRATKFWRDWYALKLIPELRAAFKEIGDLIQVVDCE